MILHVHVLETSVTSFIGGSNRSISRRNVVMCFFLRAPWILQILGMPQVVTGKFALLNTPKLMFCTADQSCGHSQNGSEPFQLETLQLGQQLISTVDLNSLKCKKRVINYSLINHFNNSLFFQALSTISIFRAALGFQKMSRLFMAETQRSVRKIETCAPCVSWKPPKNMFFGFTPQMHLEKTNRKLSPQKPPSHGPIPHLVASRDPTGDQLGRGEVLVLTHPGPMDRPRSDGRTDGSQLRTGQKKMTMDENG